MVSVFSGLVKCWILVLFKKFNLFSFALKWDRGNLEEPQSESATLNMQDYGRNWINNKNVYFLFFNLNRYRPKSPGWISHEKQENNQTKSSHQRLRHNMMVKWIMLLECCVLLGNTSWCYFDLCHPAQYHCRPQTVYWRWTCCRQLLSEVPLSWELFSKPASWFWICDSSYHFIWSR